MTIGSCCGEAEVLIADLMYQIAVFGPHIDKGKVVCRCCFDNLTSKLYWLMLGGVADNVGTYSWPRV